MNNKKYELVTSETKQVGERTLYRVRALRDFDDVKKGMLGGWVESESNLSHGGECWVSGDAQVYEDARVYGDAQVFGNALVYGDALVSGDAWVSGDAQVYEDAEVYGYAEVYENALVSGKAWVYGDARVYGDAQVYGNAWVYDSAQVFGDARVTKCLHMQQLRHDITVTDTHVFIGCEGHTWKHWSENIEVIGRKHGYSEEEVKYVKHLLDLLKTQF